jgi:hypothetical protein
MKTTEPGFLGTSHCKHEFVIPNIKIIAHWLNQLKDVLVLANFNVTTQKYHLAFHPGTGII